jgi:hypothetical protein
MGGGWQDGSDGACAGATLGCALYGNEYGHCDAMGQYCHNLAIAKPKIHATLHELNIDVCCPLALARFLTPVCLPSLRLLLLYVVSYPGII